MTIKQFETEGHPGNGMFKSLTETWHTKPYPKISPSRPELSAHGKVVFITGGGSGIGKSTALAFAEAGAMAIAIFGRRVNKLESAAQEIKKVNSAVTTIPVSVDLRDRAAVEKAFGTAAQQAGGTVDIYINNAGILPDLGPVAGYKEDEYRRTLESNMLGTFNAVQSVLPHLSPQAKVIEVSSGIGHISPFLPGVWAYAATHAANTKLFQFLQAENPALHVVSTQPGVIDTEINAHTEFRGQDDINLPAHFHVWLASPEAEFLKGKFVWVNWDVDELIAGAEQIRHPLALQVLLNGVPM